MAVVKFIFLSIGKLFYYISCNFFFIKNIINYLEIKVLKSANVYIIGKYCNIIFIRFSQRAEIAILPHCTFSSNRPNDIFINKYVKL